MARLERAGLAEVIPRLTQPVLGICLGMQLLFEASEEGDTRCLGVFPGRVRRMTAAPGRPVPHMGWNRVASSRDHALLEGLDDGDFAYFVHSYRAPLGAETRRGLRLRRARSPRSRAAATSPARSSTRSARPALGARFLANFLELVVMELVPAIDLRGGRAVRLLQGDFARETPARANAGASCSAASPPPAHAACTSSTSTAHATASPATTRVLRCARRDWAARASRPAAASGALADVERVLAAGAERAVVGQRRRRIARHGRGLDRPVRRRRLVAALDVRLDAGRHASARDPRLAARLVSARCGTTRSASRRRGLRHVLCTDIGRDGALSGPNLAALPRVRAPLPRHRLAGVGRRARRRGPARARRRPASPAAISGRALIEDRIPLRGDRAILARRIIPCLDVRDGQVVKGVRFRDHRVAGDILELAAATATRAPTSSCSTTSPRARKDGGSIAPGSAASRRCSTSRSASRAASAASPTPRRCSPRRGKDLGQLAGPRAPGADRRARAPLRLAVRRGRHRQPRTRPDRWRVHQYAGDPARIARHGSRHARLGGGSAGARRRRDRAQLHGPGRRARGLRHRAARSRARALRRAAGRLRRRRCTAHFADVFRAPASTPRSPRASSTTARSASRAEAHLRDRGHRGAAVNRADADRLDWAKGGGLLPADRAGRRNRRGADARLHESRGARGDARGPVASPSSAAAAARSGSRARPPAIGCDTSRIGADCDGDAILVQARPAGPVCHAGTASCFSASPPSRPRGSASSRRSSRVIATRIAEPATAATPRGCTPRARGASRRRWARKASSSRSPRPAATTAKSLPRARISCSTSSSHLKERGLGLAALAAELDGGAGRSRRLDGGAPCRNTDLDVQQVPHCTLLVAPLLRRGRWAFC